MRSHTRIFFALFLLALIPACSESPTESARDPELTIRSITAYGTIALQPYQDPKKEPQPGYRFLIENTGQVEVLGVIVALDARANGQVIETTRGSAGVVAPGEVATVEAEFANLEAHNQYDCYAYRIDTHVMNSGQMVRVAEGTNCK